MSGLDILVRITLFGLCGVFLIMGLVMVMMHILSRALKRFFHD